MAEQNDINILYGKVNGLQNDVTAIKTQLPFLKEILERHTAADEKLASTLQEMQNTMVAMNERMETQSKAVEDVKHELTAIAKHTDEKIENVEKQTNAKIKAVDDRVDQVEDKGKFDIMQFFRDNWPWVLTGLGMLFMYVSKYVKF